ncbi:hypothetical protein H5410_020473 [Solanum commersonii]|uniref:Uncharacterized protein n=1 Tax=Solanum commersonii TaxID=4109 RepID=A0A9J5ZBA7_SOLCO|nr:hypothetical protein H5410_020473 [Solanum commersonii]
MEIAMERRRVKRKLRNIDQQRLVIEGAVSSLQITKAYPTGGVRSGDVNGEVVTIACNVTVLSHLQYMQLMLVLGPFATMQAIAATFSGLLADHVFKYIGVHANKLEMFSLAFAGDRNIGIHYMFSLAFAGDRNIGLHYVLYGLVGLYNYPYFPIERQISTHVKKF